MEAVNAISWAHQVAIADDPTHNKLVRQVLAGAKRILAHRITKKVDKIAKEDAELDNVRIVTILFTWFHWFPTFQ